MSRRTPPRLALEIVDAQGHGLCVVLPDDVNTRPLRIGYRGDVEVPLPGEITIVQRRGRVYVASVRHEAAASLGGMRLPTWPVPVPLPCALAVGASEVRIHALGPATARALGRAITRVSAPPLRPHPLPPPYLADRVLIACVELTRRAWRALRDEWRLARPETKLAFATVLFATVLFATRLAP